MYYDNSPSIVEGNDLGDVSTTFHVQAPRAVAILAIHALLGMEGALKVLSHRVVTVRAVVGADGLSPGNLEIFLK